MAPTNTAIAEDKTSIGTVIYRLRERGSPVLPYCSANRGYITELLAVKTISNGAKTSFPKL